MGAYMIVLYRAIRAIKVDHSNGFDKYCRKPDKMLKMVLYMIVS